MTAFLKPSEVLSGAADLIEPEGAWTQRELARNKTGKVCAPEDKAATCWCAAGAMQRQVSWESPSYGTAHTALRTAIGKPVAIWNDTKGRTQAQVVTALRMAAELARASEDPNP